LLYVDPIDNKFHKNFCSYYQKACNQLNYWPEHYKEREERKQRAYEIIHNLQTSLEEKVRAWEEFFRAHFDRSLERAIIDGYWKKHPSFKVYVAMRLGAIVKHKKEGGQEVLRCPEEILKVLIKKYGTCSGLAYGISYWIPKK